MAAGLSNFVKITGSANYRTQSGLIAPDNAWGGHQSRIVRFDNNILRMSYVTKFSGVDTVVVMLSLDNGTTWNEEFRVAVVDDHQLLRDTRDDTCYLVSYDSQYKLSIWCSRDNWDKTTVVPNGDAQLQVLQNNQRHYMGCGISPVDGTITIVESDENITPLQYTTDNTLNDFISCRFITGFDQWDKTAYTNKSIKGHWEFTRLNKYNIGIRTTYTYMFPKPMKDLMNRFYGLGVTDLTNTAAGMPLASGYQFLHHRFFSDDIVTMNDYQAVLSGVFDPNAATATTTANFRPDDAIIDQDGRMFVLSNCSGDGSGTRGNGFWITVYDCVTNRVLADQRISIPLPTSGGAKIFEDGNRNKYIIYSNAGSAYGQLFIYRLQEIIDNSKPWAIPTFKLIPQYTDLSSQMGTTLVPEDRCVRVISTRSGSEAQSNFVDVLLQFTDRPYSGGVYPNPTYTIGGMQVWYARIQLS